MGLVLPTKFNSLHYTFINQKLNRNSGGLASKGSVNACHCLGEEDLNRCSLSLDAGHLDKAAVILDGAPHHCHTQAGATPAHEF